MLFGKYETVTISRNRFAMVNEINEYEEDRHHVRGQVVEKYK